MSYRYLDDLATADIAFEATGSNLEELFIAASDATMNVMIDNIQSIEPVETIIIELQNNQRDILLFDLLGELLFHKDASQLLLRVESVQISSFQDKLALTAIAKGERVDASRHNQRVDVKAVTLHDFVVEQAANGQWRAQVILDV